MNLEHLVVQVAIPRADKRFAVASGFVLAPGVVLTAMHAIDKWTDRQRHIQVRTVEPRPSPWVAVHPDDVICQWPAFDAAILRVQGGLPRPRIEETLARVPPPPLQRWRASGFPRTHCTSRDLKSNSEVRSQVPVEGTLPASVLSDRLELDVAVAPDLWMGMSGAGVIVDGRFAAIIVEAKPGFGRRRLSAVPLCALLAEQSFVHAAGLPPNPALYGVISECQAALNKRLSTTYREKFIPELYAARVIDDVLLNECQLPLALQFLRDHLALFKALAGSLASEENKLVNEATTVEEFRRALDRAERLTLNRIKTTEQQRGVVANFGKLRGSLPAVRRNTIAVVARAGAGKSCSLIRLVQRLLEQHRPAVLLPASQLAPKRDEQLEQMYGPLENIKTLRSDPEGSRRFLRDSGVEWTVVIDGLNEAAAVRDARRSLIEHLADPLVPETRFVLSCRDHFWESFASGLRPFLLHTFDLSLDSNGLAVETMENYLRYFGIEGQLAAEAVRRCSHPLLLHLFCTAYRGRSIGRVTELRYKTLFRDYWAKKAGEVAEHCEVSQEGVDAAVRNVSFTMFEGERGLLSAAEARRLIAQSLPMESERVFMRLTDADVLCEAAGEPAVHRLASEPRVAFVYDEFADYAMASAIMVREKWEREGASSIDRRKRVAEIAQRSTAVPMLRGVCEYLLLLSEDQEEIGQWLSDIAEGGYKSIFCNVARKTTLGRIMVLEIALLNGAAWLGQSVQDVAIGMVSRVDWEEWGVDDLRKMSQKPDGASVAEHMLAWCAVMWGQQGWTVWGLGQPSATGHEADVQNMQLGAMKLLPAIATELPKGAEIAWLGDQLARLSSLRFHAFRDIVSRWMSAGSKVLWDAAENALVGAKLPDEWPPNEYYEIRAGLKAIAVTHAKVMKRGAQQAMARLIEELRRRQARMAGGMAANEELVRLGKIGARCGKGEARIFGDGECLASLRAGEERRVDVRFEDIDALAVVWEDERRTELSCGWYIANVLVISRSTNGRQMSVQFCCRI